MEDKKLVSVLDAVSRTIIGIRVNETEEYVDIENPVVVNIVPQQDQTGQVRMSLQLFPIFFKEFLADKNAPVVFRYKKQNITSTVSDIVFDFRLEAQYKQLFSNIVISQPVAPAPAPAPAGNGNVIKLFDD